MKTLILGGVRSGKSRLAESIAKQTGKKVVYVATATIGDEEMRIRIEQHKNNRPDDWIVLEEPKFLSAAIEPYLNDGHCILVDCITLWLTNLLLDEDKTQLEKQRSELLALLNRSAQDIIFVSNETSMGIIPMGELSRQFGDQAGITNQLLAASCERVILTVAGLPLTLKGTQYETTMA